ncbi:MAG: hypothetical protein R3263_07570, partial [Myxococcota bacterium]|nr:hypothetical protein [Myxococcota bacterium]
LGVATAWAGARRSLADAPAPEGVPVPADRPVGSHVAAAVDETMRAVWSATALLDPPPQPHAIADALRAAAARHREDGILEDPSRAHPLPPALEKPEIRRLPVRRAGEAEHLVYESEFEPGDPEVRDGYLGAVRNRTAHAYLWRHRDGPRPTLLCLHGYGMGRVAWDVGAWDVRWLHRELGLDVVLPVLPLHGPRALARRSGAGFLDAHPLWTNAAFAQAIWELRRLTGWLRSQGAPAVGVYGMSLGGYTTALFASLERGLACAVPSIPVASLSRLLWRDMPEERRLASEAVGLDPQLLDDAWAPHAPLRHRPRVAPDARLIVAGAIDRITPPDQALALWDHWERPALHWFPGSHLVPLGRAQTRARLASHLRAHLVRAPGGPALSHFRGRGES